MLLPTSEETRPASAALPWMPGGNRWQLVSLWDMLELNAPHFMSVLQIIAAFQTGLARDAKENPAAKLSERRKELILSQVGELLEHSEHLGLDMIRPQVHRIQDLINSKRLTNESLSELLVELSRRVQDQCSTRLFFFVPSDQAPYYTAEQPFGEKVTDVFPHTSYDIAEAGKCIALDRSTAAVFHLMRVVEAAVRDIAGKLGATYSHDWTWGQILGAMKTAIDALPKKTPDEQKRRNKFEEAHVHLRSVKIAWRDPTMHVASDYDVDTAKRIYQHADALMRSLAELK